MRPRGSPCRRSATPLPGRLFNLVQNRARPPLENRLFLPEPTGCLDAPLAGASFFLPSAAHLMAAVPASPDGDSFLNEAHRPAAARPLALRAPALGALHAFGHTPLPRIHLAGITRLAIGHHHLLRPIDEGWDSLHCAFISKRLHALPENPVGRSDHPGRDVRPQRRTRHGIVPACPPPEHQARHQHDGIQHRPNHPDESNTQAADPLAVLGCAPQRQSDHQNNRHGLSGDGEARTASTLLSDYTLLVSHCHTPRTASVSARARCASPAQMCPAAAAATPSLCLR